MLGLGILQFSSSLNKQLALIRIVGVLGAGWPSGLAKLVVA